MPVTRSIVPRCEINVREAAAMNVEIVSILVT